MLSIGAIAAGGQGYYSRDDYYTSNAAEYTIQGEYLGTGPGLLGLTDPERDFPHLLKGDHPDGRSLIGESPKAHRPGLDLTLSAPKSVSLLALVAGDTRVLEAHDRAVRQTMAFIEREYIRARGTVDGQTTHLSTSNLTAIAYRHETTRPIEGTPDPQLHTHSVLFNFTQRPDGEWRAISNEAILDNQKVIDAAYKSYLERNLHELGFATTRTANGFEVRGVPADLLSEFSRRHKDILTSMSIHPGQTSRDAAVYTREPKANERDPAARLQLWLDRAAALGSTPASIRAVVAREGELARASAAPPQGPPSGPARLDHAPEPGREIDRVIAALERDTAWWTRDDMLRAGSPYLRGNLTPEDFSRQIDAAGNRGDLLKLGENKFTSPDALRTEQAIIGHVTNTRTHADPPPAHDAAAIEQRWSGRNPGQTPTGEQVAAAGFLVGSQDHVIALQGPPGTGKTSVLGVAHDLWREQGYTVTGLAQVKQAAENLQSRTDIPSQTIEGYLQKHADPSQTGSSEPAGKQILVIDEAAVVGSRNMLDLLEAAARNHVEKIVLVGDTRQLEPIGAGKPFEDLLSRGLIPAADLTQVQRQHEGTLREAVNALYNKDTPRAVELLDTIGAIREHAELNAFGKPDIPVETMARDFAALDPERRADTLVQLPTHRHRDAFNDAAREHLKARGEIDRASERTFQVWRPLNLSHAEKLDPARYPQGGLVEFFRAKPDQQIPQGARGIIEGVTPNHQLTLRFPADGDRRLVFDPASHWKFNVLEPRDLKVAIGDTLVFGKNDKTLGVTNGMRGQVVALGDNSITVRIEKGDRLVTVDPRQYPYLDHGLASTIHKAQGQTVKHVMVGINPDDRHETANRGYTAITRAEESVTIYTPSKAGLVESMSEWAAHRSVMGEAMGEQGRHAGPGPQGQSAPTTGVTQAPEQAVASSEPTPSPFTSWPAHTVSPPVIPTPEREREQKPEEKTEKKPEKEQAAKELDQEKEKHPSGAPTKGGADAEDTPQTKDASQPDDRRPLNRAGQMLYGPDRLRATFGPKHWRASAMQPNQTWAKSKYVLQAKSFGEGLRRMTHRVRAVRVQQTWAGRGNAIREAKGAWGTLKAAYAPTAKTIYLVDKPFRGVRHAGRIASAPTIGSAFRRTFERQERMYDPKAKEFVGQQRQPSGRSDVARGPQPPSTFWKALATVSRVGLGYRPPDQPNRFERWLGNITKESGDGWKKIGGVTKKETLHATRSAWSGLKEAGAGWAKIGITGGRGLAHAATTISRVARQAGSKLKQQVEKLGRGKTGQTPDKDKPVEQTERKPAPTPATTPEQTTAVTPGQADPFFAQAGQAISPPVIPTPEREREGNKGKTEPEQGKEKKEPEQDTGKGKTEQDKETTGKQSDGKGFDFKRWPEHTVSPPVIPTPEREREQQTTSLTPTTGTGQSTGLATTTGQAVDKDKSTQAPSPEKADKDAPPHDKAGPQSKDAPQSKEGPPQAKEPSHDKSAGGKSPRDPKGHPEPQKEAPGPGGSKGREAADQGKGKTPGREKKPEQDKDARSHQNDRLKFQQEGSSEKSEKGKEDFGRG